MNTDTPIEGLYRIRVTPLVTCHLLVDDDRKLVILDTGMRGQLRVIDRLLPQLGRDWSDVKAILLTHGHLDHAGGAWRMRKHCDAPIYCHPDEQQHIDGTFPYRGINRLCGWLEGLGRAAFGYEPVTIDVPIHDGDELPFWGGLRVMHLPGHSIGHCGFYNPRRDLLFAGDLFAQWGPWTRRPPPWFNSFPEQFPVGFGKVRELNPKLIVPNHYTKADYREMRHRFDRLCEHVMKEQCDRPER